MPKNTMSCWVAVALSAAAAVQAQDRIELAGADRLIGAPVVAAAMTDATRVFVSSEIAGGRVVKNAPYAATATSETTQTLMDGNRIVRSTSTRLARDGEGRTRQERRDGSVYLHDPVAGKAWLLRPVEKTAIELPRPLRMHPGSDHAAAVHNAEEMRSWSDSMRHWAHEFSARWRTEAHEAGRESARPAGVPATDTRVIVARAPQGDGAASAERDVRVEVVSGGDVPPPPRPGMPPMPPMPPSMAPLPPGSLDVLPFAARLPREGGAVTALGKRDFEGVSADGTRTTWTIPAGRIGNEKPIEIISERWYAPDLMVVLHTRYFDPRSGESVYRLTQLKRGEPDAALFQVPSDYTVRAPRERRERKDMPDKK